MSCATIESPVTSSQLFFAWSEQAEVGVAPPAAALKWPDAQSSVFNQPPVQRQSAATNKIAQMAKPSQGTAATQNDSLSRSSNCLSFTRDARFAQPVRMGALMIKLLKRYGITDQEIAEGVANYARKHQQAMAS